MAFINDPDQFTATELSIDINARTWTLNQAGLLNESGATAIDNGATGQAVYSYFKEQWRANTNYGGSPLDVDYLIKHPFPVLALTREQFEFGNNGSQFNGWLPANDTTRQFLRTCGWAEYNAAGSLLREYTGVITLGGPQSDDQAYYENQVATPTNFVYPGAVNEAVQIYGDATNGNFTRKTLFNVFVREEGQTYNSSNIGDIGVTTLETIVNRFPLGTSADANWDVYTDFAIGSAPYNAMSINYFTSAQSRNIDAVPYDFHVIVEGANADRYRIYNFLQYQLRQNADIDAGSPPLTINGKTANVLALFDGTTLITQFVDETAQTGSPAAAGGVWIDNFDVNDKNDIKFTDSTGTIREFAFVAAGTFDFNTNLETDSSGKYWAYFQYTSLFTASDVTVTPSGSPANQAAISSSATLDFTDLANGEQFRLNGFLNSENNGIWEAVGAGGATSVTAIKIRDEDGVTISNPVSEDTTAASPDTVISYYLNPYGSADALLVQDSTATDIKGDISGADKAFDFAYATNVQGGRTAGTDAQCIALAIGLDTAQYIEAPFTITENTGLTIPVNANRERVYTP